LRRSRDRFKSGDKQAALATTHFVLITTAKLLAPFMPFLAEDIYQRMTKGAQATSKDMPKSVHLTAWPQASDIVPKSAGIHKDIIMLMAEVRRLSSLGLEARSKAKINVRQPLASLAVKHKAGQLAGEGLAETMLANEPELIALITDEVNIKAVVWKDALGADMPAEAEVELDTVLTPELKAEGNLRDLIRAIQDFRKTSDLTISDVITLNIATDDAVLRDLVKQNEAEIKQTTGLKAVTFSPKASMESAGDKLPYALSIVR
jgi:isoleucyl-tRNA synthetase